MIVGSLEYSVEAVRIFKEGGNLWLIERTDTSEFLYMDFSFNSRGSEQIVRWEQNIHAMMQFFLTKEDAEKFNPRFREGGCSCCGHGSEEIPIQITEHEFVPNPPEKTKCIVCETETDNEVWCDMHTPLV